MPVWIAIALGGAVGALLRYATVTVVTHWAQRWHADVLPFGILLVNIAGSFALGCAFMWLQQRVIINTELSEPLKLAVTVGFLGALTTFSTFALDSVNLMLAGEWLRAVANILLNVLLCCAAVMLAFYIFKATPDSA